MQKLTCYVYFFILSVFSISIYAKEPLILPSGAESPQTEGGCYWAKDLTDMVNGPSDFSSKEPIIIPTDETFCKLHASYDNIDDIYNKYSEKRGELPTDFYHFRGYILGCAADKKSPERDLVGGVFSCDKGETRTVAACPQKVFKERDYTNKEALEECANYTYPFPGLGKDKGMQSYREVAIADFIEAIRNPEIRRKIGPFKINPNIFPTAENCLRQITDNTKEAPLCPYGTNGEIVGLVHGKDTCFEGFQIEGTSLALKKREVSGSSKGISFTCLRRKENNYYYGIYSSRTCQNYYEFLSKINITGTQESFTKCVAEKYSTPQ